LIVNGIRTLALWIWRRWEPIARRIGDFQARLVLFAVYFVVGLPLALVARVTRGKYGATGTPAGSFWTARPPAEHSVSAATRQY
jgi:hypothetical protein